MFVYTMQPVVQPVVKPVVQPVVSCKRAIRDFISYVIRLTASPSLTLTDAEQTSSPFLYFLMPFLSLEQQPKYPNNLSPRQQASSESRHCLYVFGAEQLLITGSIALSRKRRYLSYSEGDFEVFRPTG